MSINNGQAPSGIQKGIFKVEKGTSEIQKAIFKIEKAPSEVQKANNNSFNKKSPHILPIAT